MEPEEIVRLALARNNRIFFIAALPTYCLDDKRFKAMYIAAADNARYQKKHPSVPLEEPRFPFVSERGTPAHVLTFSNNDALKLVDRMILNPFVFAREIHGSIQGELKDYCEFRMSNPSNPSDVVRVSFKITGYRSSDDEDYTETGYLGDKDSLGRHVLMQVSVLSSDEKKPKLV